MAEPLTLMAVHAHPDDEASSTGGILARYSAEGVRTIVVTCTNGEYGDGTDRVKPGEPGHDPELVRKIRMAELDVALEALGVNHSERLGYHDSGLIQWEYKDRPDVSWNADVNEASDRLVALFEQYRPQVVVTYDENGGYGHPDHVQTHRITMAAMEKSTIPQKLYFTARRRADMEAIRKVMEERGLEMPGRGAQQRQQQQQPQQPAPPPPDPERIAAMERREARITTSVETGDYADRKRAALAAHASQLDNSWWLRFPADVMPMVFAQESFIRVKDTTGAPTPETDLFAGLR